MKTCMADFSIPLTQLRLPFYLAMIKGDSGHPAFLVLNNEIVLLTVWTFGNGGTGTSVTAFKEDINQLMLNVGGTEQLEEVDLSVYDALP